MNYFLTIADGGSSLEIVVGKRLALKKAEYRARHGHRVMVYKSNPKATGGVQVVHVIPSKEERDLIASSAELHSAHLRKVKARSMEEVLQPLPSEVLAKTATSDGKVLAGRSV